MTREMSDRRLVETCSGVDVDGVCNFVCHLSWICRHWMCRFVVPRGCEQQTAVRREGQSSEERGQGFVVVDVCIFDS